MNINMKLDETKFTLYSIVPVFDSDKGLVNYVTLINEYGDKIYFESIGEDIDNIDSSCEAMRIGDHIEEFRAVDCIDFYLLTIINESHWGLQVKSYTKKTTLP
jgi:hypothetical protein